MLTQLFDQEKYEESKLILLLADDSEYAFQLLYDRHRNRIYKTAIRFLKSPILAQEVVQDVFMKLWFSRKNMNASQPIEAWLHTVAKNNIINRLKKLSNEWKALTELPIITTYSNNTTENTVQEAEYISILNQAISTLPEQQKKAFQLSRTENMTYIQIGEHLGLSPLTVKTHISRALTHIKLTLAKKGIVLSLAILTIIC